MNPLLEVDWKQIGTEFIVYSSNNDKIMHGYAPLNSNIVNALCLRPPHRHVVFAVQDTNYDGLSCWDATD